MLAKNQAVLFKKTTSASSLDIQTVSKNNTNKHSIHCSEPHFSFSSGFHFFDPFLRIVELNEKQE